MKQIIKQCIEQLRSQRMLTTVSIAGTALSILLIMVVVMIEQVKVVPFAPESNRDRSLHIGATWLADTADTSSASGALSYKMAKEITEHITSAEAVSIYFRFVEPSYVNTPSCPTFSAYQRPVDNNFWHVFDFTFISGKPFDKATFNAGKKVAVIDAGTARRLFGSTDVAGREFSMDYRTYEVCGVVKDVTKLAKKAFANIWIPATASPNFDNPWFMDILGDYSVTILAKSSSDFDAIRAEFNNNFATFNKTFCDNTGFAFDMLGRPYTQEYEAYAIASDREPDIAEQRRSRLIIYAILLIIPAINLSGMTESRLRRRVEEIGVRRAFGCRRNSLMMQLVGENLIITVAAGIIGWILSVVFTILFSGSLFTDSFYDAAADVAARVDLFMLMKPSTFLWALLFCFILNLMSSGIPAWKASRSNIVNAINKR